MKKQIEEFEGMKYIIRFPDGFNENSTYPTIFFLHGAGSRGNDIGLLETNPFFSITDKFTDFPFITVAPLCYKNTWFDIFEKLQEFVIHCIDFKYVDNNRTYLMGASMGGYAVWQLAMSIPKYFAAIVPICGGGMYWNAGRLINVPIWAFHGQKDNCVYVEESEKMVAAVNSNNGNAKLTVYPENGHDAWSDTYLNTEVYDWLLSNKKQNSKKLVNNYNGSAQFG